MANRVSSTVFLCLVLVLVAATMATSSAFTYQEPSLYERQTINAINGQPLYELNFTPLERSKRSDEADSVSDVKLKKGSSPTKKPTQLIKQKPVVATPSKSTGTVTNLSSSGIGTSNVSMSTVGGNEPTSLSPSSSSSSSTTVTLAVPLLGMTSEAPFYAPEDVTLPPNTTESEDHHQYYNSTVIEDKDEAAKYWTPLADTVQHLTHEMLSNSHRRAATVQLKFSFPFYGHPIQNVTIATGGFLYLGDTVHSWLAATQYIAPLMANFDTSISNVSSIKYVNNASHFIVQWNDVQLQDQKPPGNFSFQVTLLKDGDIIFAYKDIPFSIAEIPDSKHPVKVGISDAYVIDRTVFFIRRKTIYEYHRADLKKENISNNTAIYFNSLPTCISLSNCESCLSTKITFDCKWCDAAQRCSDGFDRHRQDWLVKGCDGQETLATNAANKDISKCKAPSSSTPSSSNLPAVPGERQRNEQHASSDSNWNRYQQPIVDGSGNGNESHSPHHGAKVGIITVLAMIALAAGVGLWAFYAYKNPQTGAGQFLIKYRPAEWRWNGPGDTRYTAASIHM